MTTTRVLVLLLFTLVSGQGAAIELRQAIEQALLNSPEVREGVYQRLSSDEQLNQAEAGFLPNVDLTGGIGYEHTDSPGTRLGSNDQDLLRRELGFLLRQMLFDGFTTQSEVDRQQARVAANAEQLLGTAHSIALRSIEAYFDLVRYRRLKWFAEDNLRTHKRIQDQVRLRSEAGVSRKSDLDQVNARVALAEASLIAAEANVADAETTYTRVIGQAAPIELAVPEQPPTALPDSLAAALDRAIAANPVLRSARADIEEAVAQNRVAQGQRFPRLDLELAGNLNDNIDGVEGRNDDLSAMLRVRYNLFDGGADRARIRQTAHEINQAKEVRNRTRRELEESLRLAWTALQSTRRQLGYLTERVKFSEATRDAYLRQFNIGQRTLLDLLNTENDVFQARQSLINTRRDQRVAHYRILADLGELLTALEIAAPVEATIDQVGKDTEGRSG